MLIRKAKTVKIRLMLELSEDENRMLNQARTLAADLGYEDLKVEHELARALVRKLRPVVKQLEAEKEESYRTTRGNTTSTEQQTRERQRHEQSER